MYQTGIQQISQFESSELYTQVIQPLQNQVSSYNAEFDEAVQTYMAKNSVMRKMKNVLNPTQKNRNDKIGINRSKFQNSKVATQELIKTMEKGHSLLLQIREQLTNQKIVTKFIVQTDEKIYQIDESKVDTNLVLSAFGGGTVSNPFSLAYSLNAEMLKLQGLLTKENEITNADILQQIWAVKPEYLERKKQEWAAKGKKREYTPFFNSKDAEIYELYQQQKDLPPLTVDYYAQLRAGMGGGGGYATPFYKLGDIASTQVKFFNLKKDSQESVANFARFSLLRDKLRQLEEILYLTDPQKLCQELIQFFTERPENISDINQITTEFNEAARKAIEQLFDGVT